MSSTRSSLTTATAALLVALLATIALLAVASPAAAQPAADPQVQRVQGDERITTAVAVAREAFPQGAGAVVLGRVDAYPDALTGAPLARLYGGPLLLTHRDTLAPQVAEEITRLAAARVVLLGGEGALAPAVADAVAALGGPEVQRIAGSDRFETAAVIAGHIVANAGHADHVYLAVGGDAEPTRGWPDAVAVSALAATTARPVLLTRSDYLPETTVAALAANGTRRVSIVGGQAVVSQAIEDGLRAAGYEVDRLAGATRFDTSLAVTEAALAEGVSPSRVWMATGGDFGDPLVAGPAAAATDGVLLLVDGHQWDQAPARQWVVDYRETVLELWIVGNEAVIPAGVDADVLSILGGGAGQSAAPGPRPVAPGSPLDVPAPAFDGTEVLLQVGDDFQAAVEANPPGTAFRVAAGVHRAQSVAPKEGNRFTGEPGAVMTGAVLLDPDAFAQQPDGRWQLAGRTEEPFFHGTMEPGHEQEAAGHDLFVDGRRLRHVNSRDDVSAAGTWYFDYPVGQVVMAEDPHGFASVELSVAEHAFRSRYEMVGDVTIEHLTVMRYANYAQIGAINAHDSANWEVAYVTVTENHGAGVRTGPGLHLHHSRIVANGQIGVTGEDGRGDAHIPWLIEYNEIAGNRTLGYEIGWEGGGTKFLYTTNSVFQFNWVHDNSGPGVWWDTDNSDGITRSNLVEDNGTTGIMYEISYGGLVYDNVVRRNGLDDDGDWGAGVFVSNTSDVEIFSNLIEDNRTSVLAAHYDRGDGGFGTYRSTGLSVHHNDMDADVLAPGLRVYTDEAWVLDDQGVFEDNTHRMADDGPGFFWGDLYSWEDWQARGHDVNGRLLDQSEPASLPASAQPFVPAPYGATSAG